MFSCLSYLPSIFQPYLEGDGPKAAYSATSAISVSIISSEEIYHGLRPISRRTLLDSVKYELSINDGIHHTIAASSIFWLVIDRELLICNFLLPSSTKRFEDTSRSVRKTHDEHYLTNKRSIHDPLLTSIEILKRN